MRKLVLLALVGLGAQLIDGSLGMAYGVTSSTLLLALGTNPAAASATVHLAEIGTTMISGASHWKFGTSWCGSPLAACGRTVSDTRCGLGSWPRWDCSQASSTLPAGAAGVRSAPRPSWPAAGWSRVG